MALSPALREGRLRSACQPCVTAAYLKACVHLVPCTQVESVADTHSNALAIGTSDATAKKGGKAVAITDVSWPRALTTPGPLMPGACLRGCV